MVRIAKSTPRPTRIAQKPTLIMLSRPKRSCPELVPPGTREEGKKPCPATEANGEIPQRKLCLPAIPSQATSPGRRNACSAKFLMRRPSARLQELAVGRHSIPRSEEHTSELQSL